MFGADRSTMRLSEGYRNAAHAAFVALLGVASGRPRPLAPQRANQVWAYDFVYDRCANGQPLKCLCNPPKK